MKRILRAILIAVIALTFFPAAFAAGGQDNAVVFSKDYYAVSKSRRNVEIVTENSENIPEWILEESFTLSIDFIDMSQEIVSSVRKLPASSVNEGESVRFNTDLSFIGLDAGSYSADITIAAENGDSYRLGTAPVCITDKTVIENAYILNYGNILPSSAESFYLVVETQNMFVDFDKINVKLFNDNGDVVAESVSEKLYDASCQTGTVLLYEMEIIAPMNDEHNEYRMEFDADAEIVSNIEYLYVDVTNSGIVKRTKLVDGNRIEIYTENIPQGDYEVTDDEIGQTYYVTIDTDGVGVFQPENLSEGLNQFDLNGEDGINIKFSLYIGENHNKFSPSFISEDAEEIRDFTLEILVNDEMPSVEKIEHIHIKQNSENVAAMRNLKSGNVYYCEGEEGNRFRITGDIFTDEGKQFAEGNAQLEIKFQNGSLYTLCVPVKNEGSGIYGEMVINNSCSNEFISADCENLVGDRKISFVLKDTNAVAGNVTLRNLNTYEIEEYSGLSSFPNENDGFYYTYRGEFNDEINENDEYELTVSANGENKSIKFRYYDGKAASQNLDLIAINNRCFIEIDNLINISAPHNLSFKAEVKGTEYDIDTEVKHYGDGYIEFTADFSAVPRGYFTLKAYEEYEEVKLNGNTGYNYGNTDETAVLGSGSVLTGDENDIRELRIYGENLDRVEEASVKIFRQVPFDEVSSGSNSSKTTLEYVKDITLQKPYEEAYIGIDRRLISDLATGNYLFIYVLDGKIAETQQEYISAEEHIFAASIILNNGVELTNKDSVELTVNSTGYTKMRLGFTREELEGAEYEEISPLKTISLAEKNGNLTLYVQFANYNETETVIKECSITVDRESLYLYDIVIPQFEIRKNADIVFSSGKRLENSFVIVKSGNSERKYMFEHKGEKDGKYIYVCNIYIDSFYEENTKFTAQIFAYDKIGNEAKSEETEITVIHPRKISGTVTSEGNPVENVPVCLYDRNGDYLMCKYTNEAGVYSFEGVYKNKYSIKVNHSDYEEETLSVEENEFVSDITGKDFSLTKIENYNSIISVNVKGFNDKGIRNVYVSVFSQKTEIKTEGVTDENGNIDISVPYHSEGCLYRIYASSNGFSESAQLWVDSEFENIEFVFPQKAVIKGVTLYGEEKIANAEIKIEGSGYNTYTHTNENGEFSADVYFINENRTFDVTVKNSPYSAAGSVEFDSGIFESFVTLNLMKNIKIKGSLTDKTAKPVSVFDTVVFSGNGIYQSVALDNNGRFETPEIFTIGTYSVYAEGKAPYSSIKNTFEITEKDLKSSVKEFNVIACKAEETQGFSSAENRVSATADAIAKGDRVTVNIKFHNDGGKPLSNIVLCSEIPKGTDVIASNGEMDGTLIKKNIAVLKSDEAEYFTFTLDTDSFNEDIMMISSYALSDGEKYPIGAVIIRINPVSLSAPSVVKANTSFKVSGRASSKSVVEILDYYTKEVIASTELVNNNYCIEVNGIDETTTIAAKVTNGNNISYSEPVKVLVEKNPVVVNNVKIRRESNSDEYGINKEFGYPVLSIWQGERFSVKASFENMPADGAVSYSFANKRNISAVKNNGYYNADIENWNGYGTKEVKAFVAVGDKVYEFTVARLVVLIAPTGYILDSETGLPVSGAEILLKVRSGEEWIIWDAEPYYQQNPVSSDDNGCYGWTMPEGEYIIVVNADGYKSKTIEKYDSEDYGKGSRITVPPIRTDIAVKLDNIRTIELLKEEILSVAGEKIRFVFNRPVDTDTVNPENFRIFDENGNKVEGNIVFAENNTVVLFKSLKTMKNGTYRLSLSNIKDKANHTLPAEEILFDKKSAASELTPPEVKYNSDGTVSIKFSEGKIPVNIEEISVRYASSVISGMFRKSGNTVIFIPDSPLAVNTTYSVVISEAFRNDFYEYAQSAITVTFKTGEEDSPEDTETNPPSGGTSGSGSSGTGGTGSGGGGGSGGTGGTGSVKKKREFSDVDGYDWAKEAISFLSEKGIIKGISETEFAPGKDIKRADYMLLIVRMLGLNADFTENFTDVLKEKYYYKEIGAAKALGLTTGIGNNMFNPEASITRQDMFVLAYRILSMKGIELKSADNSKINIFADYSEIAGYAQEAIAALVENELVRGTDNFINPEGNATRAETAVFIYRVYNLLNYTHSLRF